MDAKISTPLYKQILVYRRSNDSVYVYVCMEMLRAKKYCVHQLEIIDETRLHDAMKEINFNLFDTLLYESPVDRCDWFDSLEIAIANHDKQFEN